MYEYRINIVVDGENIFVPRSVFIDLYNLNSGKVIVNGENMVLILSGGDAAEAKNVIIEFDKNRIIRKREYLLCCDPRLLFEETVFHQVRL